MSQVYQTVHDLSKGVSEVPAPRREMGYVEAASNVVFDPKFGIRRRGPSHHLATLTGGYSTSARPAVFGFDLGAAGKYIIVVANLLGSASLQVFNATTGASVAVTMTASVAYLLANDPSTSIRAAAVGTTVYLLNRTKVVTTTGTTTGTLSTQSPVQSFAGLPGGPISGDVYRVVGDQGNTADDFYVKWSGTVWEECALPGIDATFTGTLMPHKIDFSGTPEFLTETWGSRAAGDDTSNPIPEFVGGTLQDIFFHRGRLGFVHGTGVSLSRSAAAPGGIQQFWLRSVQTSVGSDPIYRSGADSSGLFSALSTAERLYLWGPDHQRVLESGEGPLTPTTAEMLDLMSYSATDVRPIEMNNRILFASDCNHSTQMRVFTAPRRFSDINGQTQAFDLTEQVPDLIPAGAFNVIGSAADQVVVVFASGDAVGGAFVLNWELEENGNIAQMAWNEWSFSDGGYALNGCFLDTKLYFVVLRGTSATLETVYPHSDPSEDTLGYTIHLDRLASVGGSYDAGTNLTTWMLPYNISFTTTNLVAVCDEGFDTPGYVIPITIYDPQPVGSGTFFYAEGNWTVSPVWTGFTYTSDFTLSPLYQRNRVDEAIHGGRTQVYAVDLYLEESGYLRAEVTTAKNSHIKEFASYLAGGAPLIGAIQMRTDRFTVPVMGRNDTVTVKLVADSQLPASLSSLTWRGRYTSKRVR